MAPSMKGMPMKVSVIRESTASIQPPKYPASMPMIPPVTRTSAVTEIPMITEARVPYTTRA